LIISPTFSLFICEAEIFFRISYHFYIIFISFHFHILFISFCHTSKKTFFQNLFQFHFSIFKTLYKKLFFQLSHKYIFSLSFFFHSHNFSTTFIHQIHFFPPEKTLLIFLTFISLLILFIIFHFSYHFTYFYNLIYTLFHFFSKHNFFTSFFKKLTFFHILFFSKYIFSETSIIILISITFTSFFTPSLSYNITSYLNPNLSTPEKNTSHFFLTFTSFHYTKIDSFSYLTYISLLSYT